LIHDIAAAQREGEERKHRAARLLATITNTPRVRPIQPLPGAVPGYLRLPLRVKGGLDGLADPDTALRLGVQRSYPKPLGELPAVRARSIDGGRGWRGAETLCRELITLPTHSWLSVDDLEQLVRAVIG
jgi:dTDP-4-amino-4,6-dideoxygalactose transaminase